MQYFITLLLCLCVSGLASQVAAQAFVPKLTLGWKDNSTNETGFAIERGLQQAGPFAEIGTVAANTVTYVDTTVATATVYCYRLREFNERMMNSKIEKQYGPAYSNVMCGSSVPLTDGTPSNLLMSAQEAIGNAQELLGNAAAKIARAMQTEHGE